MGYSTSCSSLCNSNIWLKFVNFITIGTNATYILFISRFLCYEGQFLMYFPHFPSLKVTDLEIQTTSWQEILDKVVRLQESQKICVVKDLSAHDVMMRIMRKENYLIGMLNKGVLAFSIPWWVPGAGPTVNSRSNGRQNHLILTKAFEWVLNWCIFQSMFDR